MKLADALAITLRDWGVRYVFGVSGANVEHLHDAIHRLGDGALESVLAKSEVGAAFMADARARAKKTLGVCCATSGGGMMNLAVGIAESYQESVPVLAIVGQVPSTLEGRGGFQDSSGKGRTVDALAMWRAMTKYAARIDSADGFWEKLADAARAALHGRPGPSVLLVTRDAYALDVPPRPAWFPADLDGLARPVPFARDRVRALFEALRTARRPVLVVGTGATRSRDADAIARFAIEAGVPVMTTMADPAAFPNDDPRYLGVVGAAGHPSAHEYVNERADFVVAVGTGLGAMIRGPIARGLGRCRVAVVNVDPGEIVSALSPAIVVEGDAGLVFGELRAMHAASPFVHPPVAYELTRYLPELVPSHADDVRAIGDAGLLQSQAIDILEGHLPAKGHVFFDAGNCAAASIHGMSMPRGATSNIALGMGGMGYAIAGAIGAQLGEARGTRSIVLCGDGAFLMLGFEIHTAVERGLPILFVVFNNAAHGMCVTRQRTFFEGRVEASEYARVDVATIARGLGGPSRLWVGRAATAAQLRKELEVYRGATPRPGVLELVLTREEVPPFAPFLAPDHPTYVVGDVAPASGWVQPAVA
jgi:acetolactate synthase-1/2/3 large subunit